MHIDKKVLVSVIGGVVIGGGILFGLFSFGKIVVQDHKSLIQVVSFLQSQIDANQKAQQNQATTQLPDSKK